MTEPIKLPPRPGQGAYTTDVTYGKGSRLKALKHMNPDQRSMVAAHVIALQACASLLLEHIDLCISWGALKQKGKFHAKGLQEELVSNTDEFFALAKLRGDSECNLYDEHISNVGIMQEWVAATTLLKREQREPFAAELEVLLEKYGVSLPELAYVKSQMEKI